jgi:hypothetical protein
MSASSETKDFPYIFPQYLSPVLQILGGGADHHVEEIRRKILAEYPLTPEQLSLRRSGSKTTVFVNKVAFAFNRLVPYRAIEQVVPDSYRITAHGRDVPSRCPKDAGERDL